MRNSPHFPWLSNLCPKINPWIVLHPGISVSTLSPPETLQPGGHKNNNNKRILPFIFLGNPIVDWNNLLNVRLHHGAGRILRLRWKSHVSVGIMNPLNKIQFSATVIQASTTLNNCSLLQRISGEIWLKANFCTACPHNPSNISLL